MPAIPLPPDYPRIRRVDSFAELAAAPLADGVNALCWERTLPGDFGEVIRHLAPVTGITTLAPWLGWSFVVAVVAIAGLPPLGIFMSEFLVVSSTFSRAPLLACLLVLGLLIAFGALLTRLSGLAFGAPQGSLAPVKASYLPMFAHLALVLGAGLYLPPPLVAWFQHVARILG